MNLQCFPLPPSIAAHSKEQKAHPIQQWLDRYPLQPSENTVNENPLHGLTGPQQNALAVLIPLLLCGEQSAVHVFNNEYKRLSQISQPDSTLMADSLRDLAIIEADERRHEEALQRLLAHLPEPENLYRIKREAQLFYSRIQRSTPSMVQHFYSIAQLDACVCVLMNTVANGDLQHSEVATLFTLIKKDEAKHVKLATRHVTRLLQLEASIDEKDISRRADEQPSTANLQHQLVTLLQPQTHAFKALGINSENLFKRLLETEKPMLAYAQDKQSIDTKTVDKRPQPMTALL